MLRLVNSRRKLFNEWNWSVCVQTHFECSAQRDVSHTFRLVVLNTSEVRSLTDTDSSRVVSNKLNKFNCVMWLSATARIKKRRFVVRLPKAMVLPRFYRRFLSEADSQQGSGFYCITALVPGASIKNDPVQIHIAQHLQNVDAICALLWAPGYGQKYWDCWCVL